MQNCASARRSGVANARADFRFGSLARNERNQRAPVGSSERLTAKTNGAARRAARSIGSALNAIGVIYGRASAVGRLLAGVRIAPLSIIRLTTIIRGLQCCCLRRWREKTPPSSAVFTGRRSRLHLAVERRVVGNRFGLIAIRLSNSATKTFAFDAFHATYVTVYCYESIAIERRSVTPSEHATSQQQQRTELTLGRLTNGCAN